MLAETGIRVLRERPVFTTPNVFPPEEFEQVESTTTPPPARWSSRSTATSASSAYASIHPFYDQLCPDCGDFNFAKRTETADLSGRVALLTGGRVKIGYQAGIKLLRAGAHADRDDALPARLRGALRARARLRRVGRPARDLRARPAPHAERRGVLHAPARRRASGSTSSSTTPARRCGARPSSTATCSRASTDLVPSACPRRRAAAARRVSRGCAAPTMLPPPGRAGELSQVPLLPRTRGRRPLPRGPARPDLQQVDLRDRNSWRLLLAEVLDRRAARDAARERGRAVRAQRAPEAAHARARPSATSTSSTSRRSRGSSTAASRRPGTRTRTWRRRR